MKRAKTNLTMTLSFLLMCVALGCKNEDYPEKVVQPDETVGSRYSSFFNMETSNFFSTEDHRDISYVFNSQDELRSHYQGSTKLPEISFNSYTLILGKVMTKDMSYSIESKILTVKDVVGTMSVELYPTGYGGWPDEEKAEYIWGLYPKRQLDKVSIKKVYLDNSNLKEPTETTLFGKSIPVKRVKRSGVPTWLVDEMTSLSADYVYEGKWKGGTIYIIQGSGSPDIYFIIQPMIMKMYDSKGNTITIEDTAELTDLKCIYFKSYSGGSYN